MANAEILYVDNDPQACDSFVRSVKAHGLETDTAEDGSKALLKMAQHSYALVVVELQLPGIDGDKLIEHMHHQYPETAFIVVGNELEQNVCWDTQLAGFVSDKFIKPWNERELVSALHRALELQLLRRAQNQNMMTAQNSVLLIEDNPADAALVFEYLSGWSSSQMIEHCTSLSAAIELLNNKTMAVVLCDLNLPDSGGLVTVSRLLSICDTPIIVLSGQQDSDIAMQALRLGAQDYLEKSTLSTDALLRAMEKAIQRFQGDYLHRKLLSNNPDGMVVVDENGWVLFANVAATQLCCEEGGHLEGAQFGYVVGSKERVEVQLSSGKHVEMHVMATEWRGRFVQLITLRDISEQKHLRENLIYLAHHDPLTGLGNRALLSDRLSRAVLHAQRSGEMLGVMMLDLDRFKLVNDTLGHDAGDQLLKEFASRLKRTVRETDTVARSGGDEFVILAENNPDAQSLVILSNKILEIMAASFLLGEKPFNVTVSVGIAIYPRDGNDDKTLVLNADAALYRAKEAGRNNYQFYSAEIHRSTIRKLELESRLERALDEGQFRLFVQLQMGQENISGAEVLLRWQLPDGTLVMPSEFIPLLEQSPLIKSVEFWVIEEACRQLVDWRELGIMTRISVNLSALTLMSPQLPEFIGRLLEKHSLSADLLELEITERILLGDTNKARDVLLTLKNMGLNIALDDFGTGYSSLGYLLEFDTIDTLKLDCSFIWKMEETPRNRAILEAVVRLAHSLNMRIIAEGVETPRQLELLRELSCSAYQGYLFSRPVPIEHWQQIYQQWSDCGSYEKRVGCS